MIKRCDSTIVGRYGTLFKMYTENKKEQIKQFFFFLSHVICNLHNKIVSLFALKSLKHTRLLAYSRIISRIFSKSCRISVIRYFQAHSKNIFAVDKTVVHTMHCIFI